MSDEAETLKNILDQLKELISTAPPMPENRTPQCLELLRRASGLTPYIRPKRGSKQPEMDAQAEVAFAIFKKEWKNWDLQKLARFWREWYEVAGHKRLARMLMDVAAPEH